LKKEFFPRYQNSLILLKTDILSLPSSVILAKTIYFDQLQTIKENCIILFKNYFSFIVTVNNQAT